LQTDADRQLDEQKEKQVRASRAVQRAQKLLATQASMSSNDEGTAASTPPRLGSGTAPTSPPIRAGSNSSTPASPRPATAAVALNVQDVQHDVQLAELRGVMKAMLQELHALSALHPGESCWWSVWLVHRFLCIECVVPCLVVLLAYILIADRSSAGKDARAASV
jgi:hypothetical protein